MRAWMGVGVMAGGLAIAAPMAVAQAPAWHVAGTYAVGQRPTDVAFDKAGFAWVANFGAGTVTKLDRTGRVIGHYEAGPKPRKLVVDAGGFVWVANWGVNTLTRLSPAGRILDRYPVGELPNALAIDGEGQVWVGNMGSNSVMRLSAQGEVLGSSKVERPSSLAIDPEGQVWATSLTGGTDNVVRFTREGQPAAAYTVPAMPERLAIGGDGTVWISHMAGTPARQLTVIQAGGQRQLGTGFKNQAVSVDGGGQAWVAHTEYVIEGEQGYKASNPLTNAVSRLAPDGRVLGTYSADGDAWAVKVAPWGDAWVVHHLGDAVTRLAP